MIHNIKRYTVCFLRSCIIVFEASHHIWFCFVASVVINVSIIEARGVVSFNLIDHSLA